MKRKLHRLKAAVTAVCLSIALVVGSEAVAQENVRTFGNRLTVVASKPSESTTRFNKRSGSKIDPRLLQAMQIAISRARSRSINRCWRYVKTALLKAEVVDRYPGTRYAKEAGQELLQFGFKPIQVNDPFEAPVGSILVYGGRGPGHVEFRTECGFVSDFISPNPSPRPLIGVYVKPYTGS